MLPTSDPRPSCAGRRRRVSAALAITLSVGAPAAGVSAVLTTQSAQAAAMPGGYPQGAAGRATTALTRPMAAVDTTPPTIAPLPDRTDAAGAAIQPFVAHSDEPAAIIDAPSLPPGITFDSLTRTFSGTPTTPGAYTVKLTATDSSHNQGTDSFVWTVTGTAAPVTGAPAPVVTSQPDVYVPEDQPIAPVRVAADDRAATTTVKGLPAGVGYDPVTGVVSGTPSTPGDYTVVVTSTDKAGTAGTDTFTIHVLDTTDPVVRLTDQRSTVGDEVSVVVDVDDSAATTTVVGLPTGLSYEPATGRVTGTPTALGTFEVTVVATDPARNTTISTATWTVDPSAATKAPATVDDVAVPQGTAITPIAVPADDPTATKATGLPDGLVYNSESGQITGTPTTPGDYLVTVTTAGPVVTQTFTITVTPAGTPTASPTASATSSPSASSTSSPSASSTSSLSASSTGSPTGSPTGSSTASPTATDVTAPTITPIGDTTVLQGTPITSITVTVDDSTATTDVTGLPAGVIYDEDEHTIAGTPTAHGTYPVTVTATDPAGNATTQTFVVTVTPLDTTRPVVTAIGDMRVPEDSPIPTITVKATDDGKTITPEDVTGLPEGLTWNPKDGTITGTPTTPGDYVVQVVTADAAGNEQTDTFTVHVTDVSAPAITPIADVTVTEDEPMTPIPVVVDDPTAEVTVAGLPEGTSYDSTARTIGGTPTDPKTYPVTITATDTAGHSTQEAFDIVVQAADTGDVVDEDPTTSPIDPAPPIGGSPDDTGVSSGDGYNGSDGYTGDNDNGYTGTDNSSGYTGPNGSSGYSGSSTSSYTSNGSGLASTGADVYGPAAAGLGSIALGAVLMALGRRRRAGSA